MADNDIIDFYKKADNDNKPEEPLKEQVETPEPVVSEAVVIPVPESNDPFDKFLFNLAEKLKTEKKITEQQQQQFNKRVIQPITNPEDPFAKFLESFAGLVKEDENINKEENIKEATIDFINKLKNDDFFDRDVSKVIPKVKQAKSKSKKYLPPKFAKKVEKVEEELPVIEQSTEPEPTQPEQTNNPYLKELQTADKKKNKIEDKISGLSDIKKIIAQQIQEQLSKYPNLGFTGGGGGTNAVQFAEGGTMRGDLNVTGKYLSGGVDISTLFGSGGGGGGYADRFVSGPSQFILDPDGKLHPLDNDLLTLQSENAGLSAFTRIVLSPYAFFAYDNEGNSITFDEVDNAIVLTSQDLHEWTFNSEGKLIGPSGTLAISGNVDVTGPIYFGYSNGPKIDRGIYDSNRGGLSGISLVCSAAYDFNWQAGWLTSLQQDRITPRPLYIDSGAGTSLRVWDGSVNKGIDISHTVITFPDGKVLNLGGSAGGNINTSGEPNVIFGGYGGDIYTYGTYNQTGGTIDTHGDQAGSGGDVSTYGNGGDILTHTSGGDIDTSNNGGNVITSNGGGSIDTRSQGYIQLGELPTRTILRGTAADTGVALQRIIDLPNNNGTLALESFVVSNFLPLSGGVITNNLTVQGNISATDTIYANSYLSAGVNLLDIFTGGGGGGGGVTTTKKFDFVTVSNIDYSYSGTAVQGTLETSPTWKLIRLTYANNGTISNSASAIDSWTGRLTATYV